MSKQQHSKPTDHRKPIFSEQEEAEKGEIAGYLRLVITDQAAIIDATVRPYDLAKVLAEAIHKDPDFAKVIEQAMARVEIMKNPFSAAILKTMDAAQGIECQCEKCKRKRSAVERLAKEN
jgi:hypothetical protein